MVLIGIHYMNIYMARPTTMAIRKRAVGVSPREPPPGELPANRYLTLRAVRQWRVLHRPRTPRPRHRFLIFDGAGKPERYTPGARCGRGTGAFERTLHRALADGPGLASKFFDTSRRRARLCAWEFDLCPYPNSALLWWIGPSTITR